MFGSNNKKYNEADLIRERHSSFVVDLRAQSRIADVNNGLNKEIKTNKIDNNKKKNDFLSFTNRPFFKKNKQKKYLNSGFLFNTQERKRDFYFGQWLKNIFSWKNRFDLSLLFKKKKKNNLWQDLITKQQDIFNSTFHFKKNSQKLAVAKRQIVWYRSILSFVLVLLFLILPLKLLSYFQFLDLDKFESRIMTQSKAAIEQMLAGVESVSMLDFSQADANFSQASSGFLAAKEDLSLISDSLLYLVSLSNDPKLKMAAESKKFLSAGASSASLGRNLVLATENLFNHQVDNNFSESLANFIYYGDLAVQDAKSLEKTVVSIKSDNLPAEYREQFLLLADQAKNLSDNLENFVLVATKAQELLGLSQDKRYLLIFQNNSELRASGGFLGSYALLDISDGKIKNLEVPAGGSYDTEGGMTVRVKAPEPLWLVNPSWHFWDANWWPDFTMTAQNLMWFYEKSGGSTVDGVISLTPTVVERLLEVTGPIDMTEEYSLVITSENFWETVQKVVENQHLVKTHPDEVVDFIESKEVIEATIPLEQDLLNNPENKPKKIIGDLMARILEILPASLDKDNLVKTVSLLENSLAEKHILFYFTDPALQQEVSKRSWSGEIKSSPHDYLLVVNTNIAGQKSDRKMVEKIEHFSRVDDSGRIINTVKIARTHTGLKNEALTGVRNVNWLRVYVPEGSRLIAASGLTPPDKSYFEYPENNWLDSEFLKEERLAITDPMSGFKIYREAGKTVFAGWVMVDPGETSDVVISYELPFNFFAQNKDDNNWLSRLNKILNPDLKNSLKYSLLVQKQPGASPSSFVSYLELPENFSALWQYPDNLKLNKGWHIIDKINIDKYFSVLLKNK